MENFKECRTLRVLHLPPGLTDERRVELFKQYGAVKTRTTRKSEKYTITFVQFETHDQATETCMRLHQLPVNGRLLSVEFAKKNDPIYNKENTDIDQETEAENKAESEKKKNYQAFMKKLNSWAPYHMVTQPVPPYLNYKYPKPTREILLRIALQMVKVPPLYTQVLHLMNKMSLPPPFEGLDEEFPEVKEAYDVENYQDLFGFRTEPASTTNVGAQEEQVLAELAVEEETEEESEIESDQETGNPQLHIIPEKRKRAQPKKRLKIPKFVNPLKQPAPTPSTSRKQRPEQVFDLRHADPRNRKIVLKPVESTSKLLNKVTGAEEKTQAGAAFGPAESNPEAEGFGLIFPSNKDEEETVETEEPKQEFITTEQLHDNRIPVKEQGVLPVFNNYHPGKPSCRLYIKNLAKQVEESDLHFIYRRYVLPKSSSTESEYNVRLMQEGRMKGQAFVTLPNIAQAQLALHETNGYILKDKPMVVQFAKVPKN